MRYRFISDYNQPHRILRAFALSGGHKYFQDGNVSVIEINDKIQAKGAAELVVAWCSPRTE